jgi:hypothetical protein
MPNLTSRDKSLGQRSSEPQGATEDAHDSLNVSLRAKPLICFEWGSDFVLFGFLGQTSYNPTRLRRSS